MYKRKSHSTFLIGIRRLDVGAQYNGKKTTWCPLIVTEGPTEPHSLASIIQGTVDFFKTHCPGAPATISPGHSPRPCSLRGPGTVEPCHGAPGCRSHQRLPAVYQHPTSMVSCCLQFDVPQCMHGV